MQQQNNNGKNVYQWTVWNFMNNCDTIQTKSFCQLKSLRSPWSVQQNVVGKVWFIGDCCKPHQLKSTKLNEYINYTLMIQNIKGSYRFVCCLSLLRLHALWTLTLPCVMGMGEKVSECMDVYVCLTNCGRIPRYLESAERHSAPTYDITCNSEYRVLNSSTSMFFQSTQCFRSCFPLLVFLSFVWIAFVNFCSRLNLQNVE